MKLLIIGGTIFVGKHFVQQAVDAGHEVTLFNRGRHNPDLFPQVEKLRGDRETDLDSLKGRRWDAVIDPSGYLPSTVRKSAEFMRNAADHYTFISTISVYRDYTQPGIAEEYPKAELSDPQANAVTAETYGPFKALCETAVNEGFGDSLILRPGYIVGPDDPTDRFTYWPVRIDSDKEVLAPAPPSTPSQFIDVRDLAAFMLRLIEQKDTGTYNVVGPEKPMPFGQLLDLCRQVSEHPAEVTWVAQEFLEENKIESGTHLPFWVPEDSNTLGWARIDASKAVAKGLSFRPAIDTVRDTLAWFKSEPERALKVGLTSEQQAALLKTWRLSQLG